MADYLFYLLMLLIGFIVPIGGMFVSKNLTVEIIRDLRAPRILHYVVLSGLGASLFLRENPGKDWFQEPLLYLQFSIFILCLVYAAVFAIVTNNIADLETDRITNRSRPLVQGTVEQRKYLFAGTVCLVISLLLSALAGTEMFLGIVAISAGYFVYSCKPFRLKKIPFVSKFIIGLNSFFVAVCGYEIAGGSWEQFPWIWAVFILGPLALSANFVDLKDTEGDRLAGVATFPVIFGEKNARIIISFFTLATYAMAGILLGIPWVYPLNAMVAVSHLWFLYRKPYRENWVFLVYIISLAGLDVFLFFSDKAF